MIGTEAMKTKIAPGIRQSISEIVRTLTEREDLEPIVDLFDQGVTSLAFIRVVAYINEKYAIELDVAELEEASVDSLSALVAAHLTSE